MGSSWAGSPECWVQPPQGRSPQAAAPHSEPCGWAGARGWGWEVELYSGQRRFSRGCRNMFSPRTLFTQSLLGCPSMISRVTLNSPLAETASFRSHLSAELLSNEDLCWHVPRALQLLHVNSSGSVSPGSASYGDGVNTECPCSRRCGYHCPSAGVTVKVTTGAPDKKK